MVQPGSSHDDGYSIFLLVPARVGYHHGAPLSCRIRSHEKTLIVSIAASITITLVVVVSILGFVASRWGSANLLSFDEWALGGRRFGTVVSWFLLGGDLYTAYTFLAVPALVYGAGAFGFFAVPYATIAYPLVFLFLTRFWTLARERGYLTIADFARDIFGNRVLELCVALTGVFAALPYIALQLLGIRSVFERLGPPFSHAGSTTSLIVAFALLAAYTYSSGLRAPALIAFVKDTLIYVTVIAAIIVIPHALGGWSAIFAHAAPIYAARKTPGHILLPPGLSFGYATFALGSALSLFLYPHSVTSLLAARSADVVKRNAVLLPLYSLLLGFLALLGVCAVAAGIIAKPNDVVPILFERYFPPWFAGVADAAIVVGALVPAAIMAIGAANLFASNILREFSTTRPEGELRLAKILTIAFCAAALIPALVIHAQYTINFQLVGGAIMVQIVPMFAAGIFKLHIDPRALVTGWAVGLACTVAMVATNGFTALFVVKVGSFALPGAVSIYAVAMNIAVVGLVTIFSRKAVTQ